MLVIAFDLRLSRVDAPLSLHGESPKLQCLAKRAAGRLGLVVLVAASEQNGRAAEEEKGWQGEGEPETNVFFGVDHADRTEQTTDVDHHVEVKVDAGDGDGRVHDDALALLRRGDVHLGLSVLFSDQRRNVGLETTSSDTHHNHTNDHARERTARVHNNLGRSRDDEEDVSDNGNEDRVLNRLQTTKILIGNVGTHERHGVGPERVEGGDTGGCALSHTERARLAVETSTSGRARWKVSLDEVDD